MALTIPPFPRGNGPLLSVMIPSRKRPSDLAKTIDSIWSLAGDKSNVEFLVKVDDDDQESIDVTKRLETIAGLSIKVIVSPRGNGYSDMHHWVNQMCALSRGDWLLLCNDDSRLQSEKWDEFLAGCLLSTPWFGCWDICLLCAKTVDIVAAKQFPCLRRKTYEVLGHFSLSPHNDTWITGVMDFLRMDAVDVDFLTFQHLEKQMKDDIRKLSLAGMFSSLPTIHSISAKQMMLGDVQKILTYLSGLWHSVPWVLRPHWPGWYYWDLDGGEGKFVFVDDLVQTYVVSSDGLEPMKVDRGRLVLVNSKR